ncbi:MAG: heavy-metal-associated domain-containing protein [Candidatus Kariarchaeaceae archaeon]|jgi:copper chaperone CopZ
MTTHISLKIEGMTCDSCSNSITKLLSKKDFISNIDVQWEAGTGEMDVETDDQKDQVVTLIERLGYKVVN